MDSHDVEHAVERDVHERIGVEHDRDLFALTIPELWGRIDECREEQEHLGQSIDLLHEVIAEKMQHKTETIEGFGTFRKARSASRKWDHEGLYKAVRAFAADHRWLDTTTGEIEAPDAAYERCLKAWASPPGYWRVGKLVEAGLQLDEFAETTWGPVRVQRL